MKIFFYQYLILKIRMLTMLKKSLWSDKWSLFNHSVPSVEYTAHLTQNFYFKRGDYRKNFL